MNTCVPNRSQPFPKQQQGTLAPPFPPFPVSIETGTRERLSGGVQQRAEIRGGVSNFAGAVGS